MHLGSSEQDELDAPSRGGIVASALLPQLVSASCETDAMISILKSLTAAAEDIKKEYDQVLGPSISQLSKGIDSIPDEILAIIFEVDVREEGARGATMAKLLSHVSRRFRNVALSNRSIWATLRSNGSEEEWETFIRRSGTDTGFHVFIQSIRSRNHKKWDAFMDCCWQTASRWTSLTLTRLAPDPCPPSSRSSRNREPYETDSDGGYDDHMNHIRTVEMKKDMEFVMSAFNGGDRLVHTWQFPRLFELDVQCGDLKTKLSWKSPNLRLLRYFGILPRPSAVFSSVTTFQYNLSSSSVCNELLQFIVSMPNVSDLQLELAQAVFRREDVGPLYFPSSSPCPSVTSFSLLVHAYPAMWPHVGERFIAAFLHALRIPNLAHFSCRVPCDMVGRTFDSTVSDSLGGLSRALLPVNIFEPLSRPTSINYKIVKSDVLIRKPKRNIKIPPWIFPVPLERIPDVSVLTFTTCTQVIFTREDLAGAHGVGLEPSQLREIRFSGCEMAIKDLQLTVQSLKDVGAWNTLERIVVEQCELLYYESALEVVGMERLRYPA